jgi:DNA polymerase III epsilon subunit-like protein
MITVQHTAFLNRQARPIPPAGNPFSRLPVESPIPRSTEWMPGLAGKTPFFGGMVPLFAGERKLAANSRAQDSYVRYTPYNTACPLATWHTFATSKAIAYHSKNAKVLESYINKTGEYYQDIPWVKYGKNVGEEPYTIFDTETTGLKDWDRIVQIAASQVTKDHEVRHLTDFNTYVNPGMDQHGAMFPIKPGATEVHGITEEMVKDKPVIEDFLADFRNNILKKNGLVVAYNAKFDIKYMNNVIDRWNRSHHRKEHGPLRPLENALVLDPFVLVQRIHPFVSLRKRLGDHYEILMGKELENKHDAQADVDGTVDILKYIFKYLEKHTIPLEWAKFIEKQLPEQKLEPAEKAAVIAKIVRENREALQKKMPAKIEPLKMTDVLRLQHGSPVYHDEVGLPKLDITLNYFGWDGSKVWEKKNDVLDPEVAQAVRQERDHDNHKFIFAKFLNEFVAPSQMEVRSTLQSMIHPGVEQSNADRTFESMEIKGELLKKVGQSFADNLLSKTLPNTDEEWQALKGTVDSQLKDYVDTKLKKKTPDPAEVRKLYDRLEPLSQDLITHMKALKKEVGERYFYTLAPVDPAKPLIDPAVLAMGLPDKTARRRRR